METDNMNSTSEPTNVVIQLKSVFADVDTETKRKRFFAHSHDRC